LHNLKIVLVSQKISFGKALDSLKKTKEIKSWWRSKDLEKPYE
jgi:hypothetical protein